MLIAAWRGDFGDAYTARQTAYDPRPIFTAILRPYLHDIATVLEIGCNTGDNLLALADLGLAATGIEPNGNARSLATNRGLQILDARAEDLPFEEDSFDLVLTCGLLIHIPPETFNRALTEIHRVSRSLILSLEYWASVPTPVDYRGVPEGIWKRPYETEFTDRFGDLRVSGAGGESTLEDTPFEGCSWWLFQKR